MTRAMEQSMDAPARVLRLPRVQARTGLARSTIYVRASRQQANRCGILFRTRPRASPRWPSVTSSSVKLMAVLRRWLPNAATAARDDVAV